MSREASKDKQGRGGKAMDAIREVVESEVEADEAVRRRRNDSDRAMDAVREVVRKEK